jgi:hypothetical protein
MRSKRFKTTSSSARTSFSYEQLRRGYWGKQDKEAAETQSRRRLRSQHVSFPFSSYFFLCLVHRRHRHPLLLALAPPLHHRRRHPSWTAWCALQRPEQITVRGSEECIALSPNLEAVIGAPAHAVLMPLSEPQKEPQKERKEARSERPTQTNTIALSPPTFAASRFLCISCMRRILAWGKKKKKKEEE